MISSDTGRHWQVNKELAAKYTSPLDRRLYCDEPVVSLLGDLSNKSVLDLGCGNGGFTVKLIGAKSIVGIDASLEMLKQAKALEARFPNLSFIKADAAKLPFPDRSFEIVVASMLINTISSKQTVEEVFKEAARVLTKRGRFVISMANPLTLEKSTKHRRTQWKQGQTQESLVPGEEIIRVFEGKDGATLTVPNYYWPQDVLIELAKRNNLVHAETLEPKATEEDLRLHPELDPELITTLFFLIMEFDKSN
ncbi:MAG: class I SAM-dependent methyltransferase [Candidatus Levybacteria bacterium]|nr:class I SAM-dependent methyltransferase [Candidatus Levybacteria bacterium]